MSSTPCPRKLYDQVSRLRNKSEDVRLTLRERGEAQAEWCSIPRNARWFLRVSIVKNTTEFSATIDSGWIFTSRTWGVNVDANKCPELLPDLRSGQKIYVEGNVSVGNGEFDAHDFNLVADKILLGGSGSYWAVPVCIILALIAIGIFVPGNNRMQPPEDIALIPKPRVISIPPQTPLLITYCARVQNRTNLNVPIEAWDERKGWEKFKVAPGSTWTFTRINSVVRIRWNASTLFWRKTPKEITLDASQVIGRTPTDDERNSAPISIFNFTPKRDIGIFRD